ncbi:unnamed protein product [Toxocara canis]|uniref:Immunoglobulin I-set domain protein n=1 Tax=Toxocara canis TaxID=6265 RepID=A0A183V6Y1_TOXCA|nr:unnamed protein product [Toxocara canis]
MAATVVAAGHNDVLLTAATLCTSLCPSTTNPLQDKRVIVGQNVALECQVEGHPEPVVKWLKDGQNVTQCPDYEISEDGVRHRLLIPNVQAADSGRFTIQAMNAAGVKMSSCTLIVAPAPTPIPGVKSIAESPAPPQTPVGPSAPLFLKELKHQPLKPGSQVVLEARVVGNPPPQVEWLKNGSPLKNYRAKTEYDPHTGICILNIPQMFADDVGEYTCRATNTNGVGESSAHLLPRDEYERWFHDEQSQITQERKRSMLAQSQGRTSSSSQSQRQQGSQRSVSASGSRQMQRVLTNGSSDVDTFADIQWLMSESETESELVAALDGRGIGSAPIIRSPLRGLRLTEGTDAVLQCNIIEWQKDGVTMSPTGPPRITMTYRGSLAVLKICMVLPEDSGQYRVVAENNLGRVCFLEFTFSLTRQ